MKSFKATKNHERVDKFLLEEFKTLSKNEIKKLCEAKKVLLNGKVARAGERVLIDSIVEIKEDKRKNKIIKQEIIFEDKNIIVLNKKRGIPSISLKSSEKTTVADFLLSYDSCFLKASDNENEAGLIQRLDNYTSGVILAAKDRRSWENLKSQMRENKITKSYLAFVEGDFFKTRLKVENPIEINKDKKNVKVLDDKNAIAKNVFSASSEIFLVKKLKDASVVRITGKKMRRHQVRAHLSYLGYPLIGDSLYSSKRELMEFFKGEKGFLLHAESISFFHPITEEALLFKAESAFFNKL